MDDLNNMHGFHKVLGYKYAYVFFLSIIYDSKYACFVPPVNQETLARTHCTNNQISQWNAENQSRPCIKLSFSAWSLPLIQHLFWMNYPSQLPFQNTNTSNNPGIIILNAERSLYPNGTWYRHSRVGDALGRFWCNGAQGSTYIVFHRVLWPWRSRWWY